MVVGAKESHHEVWMPDERLVRYHYNSFKWELFDKERGDVAKSHGVVEEMSVALKLL